jgi:hypothetical protein
MNAMGCNSAPIVMPVLASTISTDLTGDWPAHPAKRETISAN